MERGGWERILGNSPACTIGGPTQLRACVCVKRGPGIGILRCTPADGEYVVLDNCACRLRALSSRQGGRADVGNDGIPEFNWAAILA